WPTGGGAVVGGAPPPPRRFGWRRKKLPPPQAVRVPTRSQPVSTRGPLSRRPRSAAERARSRPAPPNNAAEWMAPRMGPAMPILSGLSFRVGVDALGERRLDEAVEVAVEHGQRIGAFHAGAQVLHQLIRLEHVRSDLL